MDSGRAFSSKKSSPPQAIGGSSVVTAAAQDLLPWQIRTRRRGSRSRPAAVAEPSSSIKRENTRMEALSLMDLPLKKRICREVAPVPVESGSGGMIHCFDLNKLPEPEDDPETLTLRWNYHDENGAPAICS